MSEKVNKTKDKKGSNKVAMAIAGKTNIKALNIVEHKLIYLVTAAMVILGDYITKAMASALYDMGKGDFPLIPGFIDFSFSLNGGMAAGKLSEARLLFIIPSILAVAATFLYLLFDKGWNPAVGTGLSLMLGGGVGNLIERLGGDFKVVDFIYVVPFDFFPFTCTFNVADVAVCVGCGILLYEAIKGMLKENKQEVTGECEDTRVEMPKWLRALIGGKPPKEELSNDVLKEDTPEGESEESYDED